jgi:DNA processing protein
VHTETIATAAHCYHYVVPDCLLSDDPRFPTALRQIPDPPKLLWVQGSIAESGPLIAIVGSRRTTRYGEETAYRLAGEIVRRGGWVVSGMARGIDSCAHRGALDAGGKTIAVLGTGIDIVYPRENRELAERIAANGALVSEFSPGQRPDKYTFVRRNRIVAGLCEVTVIVESDLDGGAMITADFACDQGRTVCAVPGRIDQPTSAGCHQLIREGATLVTSVDDILSELGFPLPLLAASPLRMGKAAARAHSAEEAAVAEALRGGDQLTLDGLAERTGMPLGKLAPAIVLLELRGEAVKRADGRFEMA